MNRFYIFLLFCAAATTAVAQVPDGSILWLRSDIGMTTSGDSVASWADQSGSALAITQTVPANRPRVVPYVLNGFPVVRFDGVTSFMNGPAVFPMGKDYTLSLVVKINNYAATNNIISGTSHAHWLGSARYPRVLHGNFNTQEVSSIAMTDSANIITFIYTEGSKNAIVYLNGQFADSAFVGPNTDSTMYLGAFQAGNLMNGDLAEVVLYDRRLSAVDRNAIESYYFNKYAIRIPPPIVPPDTTFREHPSSLQLYPRDSTNFASVRITGTVHLASYDSMYVVVKKNRVQQNRSVMRLAYGVGGAPFSFAFPIHAELSEYTFIAGIKRPGKDSVLATWDSVVCGDAYLINGQSNSIYGAVGNPSGEFCRTFGINFSANKGDTTWGISLGTGTGGDRGVGAWAMRLQKCLQDSLHMPTCFISGGVGGTTVEQHQRNDANPMDLTTIYGSLLYRVNKSGVKNALKALLWYQGESNTLTPAVNTYPQHFQTLVNAWNQDYPSLSRFYVMQIRPGCNGGPHKALREYQRELQDSLPKCMVMSVMGVPGHDGCHFNLQGYTTQGNNLFRLVRRDYYDHSDPLFNPVLPPNIDKAFYTSTSHDTIALLFREHGDTLVWPADTIVGGMTHTLAEAFYLDTTAFLIEDGWVHGDTVFLKLTTPHTAKTITYLPDQVYEGTAQSWEGPWLMNRYGLGALSFDRIPITERPASSNVQQPSALNAELPVELVVHDPQLGFTTIDVIMHQSIHAKVELRDVAGKLVKTLSRDCTGVGVRRYTVTDVAAGEYFCRVIGSGVHIVKAVVFKK